MPYIVTKWTPRTRHMSYEDILFGMIDEDNLYKYLSSDKSSATQTNYVSRINVEPASLYKLIHDYISMLSDFYNRRQNMDIFYDEQYNYEEQIKIRRMVESKHCYDEDEVERLVKQKLEEKGLKYNPFYFTFYLPKRSGRGYRQIDAPSDELKIAQTELRMLFEQMMGGNTYHTSAYAYIPKRSRVDLVKKLQNNKARWILHVDFENFFGSIDIDFTMQQLSQIFPFSEIVKVPQGKEVLYKCLKLCFLDGRLPQGTPISPLLTNIIMIPLDYKITKALLQNAMEITEFDQPYKDNNYQLIYTRYADDIFIGGHRGFEYNKVVDFIKSVIEEEKAPLKIKNEKTKYKSINGENWILGLMYNQDQNITVGRKRKKQVQAMISNFAMDIINNQPTWDVSDIQVMMGHISYIGQIEPEYRDKLIEHCNQKFGFDVMQRMKDIAYQ